MPGTGDQDDDTVLSDVEDDSGDPNPVVTKPPSSEDFSVEKLLEVLAELDHERQARVAAENMKSELQVSFKRLKALAHEAIKMRDEFGRQRDDAVREKEETARQLEETTKERDALRSEIQNSSHMLVTGMEKISAKVSSFAGNALPRSQKYTGMATVAYGVIKRANEIVGELLKQNEATAKARNEAQEQMEQRNYEIAIEVSQLEATISGLRDEVAKKDSVVEDLERDLAVRDRRLSEALQFKEFVRQCEDKLSKLESRMESQRPLLIDQLSCVSKIHNQICNVVKILYDGGTEELSESFFVPQETDVEENIRASLAGMESVYELTKIVVQKARDVLEEKDREVKSLNETVTGLVREKDQIGSLLRSALSKRVDPSSRKSELFQAAENGLREAGIDFKFSKLLGDGKVAASNEKLDTTEKEEDEIYSLGGALEDVFTTSQIEIIELKHNVSELRAELNLLKKHVEAQAKELDYRTHRIEELEEKERVAIENIEGLMMDIAAAEEEINRWKVAAEEEAAAGRDLEQEFVAQLSALKQELKEAKQSVLESEKKIKFKEETAAAAMAARDAAEKSLKLADLRSSRLRERVEELTHQLGEFENREDSRSRNGPRYVCWPWQWLGMDFVGFQQRPDTQMEASNEMELSEPLL